MIQGLKQNILPMACLATLIGCFPHPIVISPELSQLGREGIKPIDRNVGYCISDEDMDKRVESPAGADRLTYSPYKEIEPALFRVLTNIFNRAYRLKSPKDVQTIQAKNITLVFIPVIVTDSASHSPIFWPPTSFTVDLTCKALDHDGKAIWEKRITTEGKATYDEFKTDFPLAAKRATLQAMQELQKALNEAPELRN